MRSHNNSTAMTTTDILFWCGRLNLHYINLFKPIKVIRPNRQVMFNRKSFAIYFMWLFSIRVKMDFLRILFASGIAIFFFFHLSSVPFLMLFSAWQCRQTTKWKTFTLRCAYNNRRRHFKCQFILCVVCWTLYFGFGFGFGYGIRLYFNEILSMD